MDDVLAFGSRDYWLMFLLLIFSRGMDILSTWIATPNLTLEGNPIAKKLGWRGGILVNFGVAFGVAFSPMSAIATGTASLLIAARNFQSAWLMRSMGEENYRDWHISRIQETRITLYLLSLAGNTLLVAAVGVALMYFSWRSLIPFAIGFGITFYAAAVAFFTVLGVWRLRRAEERRMARLHSLPTILVNSAALKAPLANSCACESSEVPGK